MKDFLSDGGDGHACDINVEVPKYFYYGGKEYVLNFENLDYIHTKMIMHKLENNLIGEMSDEENLKMFMDFTNPDHEEKLALAAQPKSTPISIEAPKSIMYKA